MSAENPTLTPEEGPKILSSEEVEAQMAKFITGQELPKTRGGWGNPPEFSEVVTVDETGTNFFQTSYHMNKQTGDALISVIHWQKGPDDSKEWVRGSVRARYSGATGQWSDADIDFASFPFVKVSSAYEQKLVFPTPEEISKKIKELCGHENPTVIRTPEDARGTSLHEVVVTDAAGNDTIYTYRRAGEKAATTDITYASFAGKYTDNVCVGGGNLSTYDQARGLWVDVPRSEVTETPMVTQTTAEIDPDAPQWKKYGDVNILSTISLSGENPAADKKVDELFDDLLKKEFLVSLRRMFDEAEALYSTVSPEETSLEVAKEARDKAKPLLNKIYTRLIALNKSESDNNMGFSWNSGGDLTREQFDELNLRRMKLSNAVGMLYKDPSGKIMIRHDLNDI